MKPRQETIDSLVTGLAPVRPAPASGKLTVAWLLLSLAFVVAVTLVAGPLRPGVLDQLRQYPRFFLEMALGLAAIATMSVALFRSAVPGALSRGLQRLALGLVAVWIGTYVFGLVSPALEPSMLGKRPHCVFESFLYALPPTLAAVYLQRRLYPLSPIGSALLAGLCAGLMPAWFMQVACMHEPGHILSLHILPGLMAAPVAAGIVLALPGRRGGRDL